ncbi:MAG: threonylcarbamoyl-AMP synthase [Candidatus Cloacimonadota bacterium]|nr:MAG: threonylcarbamoyl-AMP synthase [Candidatus Cloacimonadota bacterium]PIE78092.1 MAG: threonylcarbamoyl-AMP synthase [Candidatus Delongbacteria bacterium]
MIVRLYEENPRQKEIDQVLKVLNNGGVIIYPTDTGYCMGCDLHSKKGLEKLLSIKRSKKKEYLSFVCSSLKHISDYAVVSNDSFKIMKKCLPGPYTFILESTNQVYKLVSKGKKSVGIRIPNNNIILTLVKDLGRPIISTSINQEGDFDNVLADVEDIKAKYSKLVDCIIDSGYIYPELSTVIDLSDYEIEIVREGKGSVDWLIN